MAHNRVLDDMNLKSRVPNPATPINLFKEEEEAGINQLKKEAEIINLIPKERRPEDLKAALKRRVKAAQERIKELEKTFDWDVEIEYEGLN